MNESYFGVRVGGPLAPHAVGYFWWLIDTRFYSPLSAEGHLRVMAYVSRWLRNRQLPPSAFSGEIVDEFVACRRVEGYCSVHSPRAVEPLVAYLRFVGLVAEVDAPTRAPTGSVIADFRSYLLCDRGLVTGTVDSYVIVADRFLGYCADRGVSDLARVTADHLGGFVLSERARSKTGSARHAVTPLRSLLRFALLRGLTTSDLALAVPRAANRRGATLPKSLTPSDGRRLLRSCDRRTAHGRRDYAVLLMLARLGLRAGELAGLSLADMDWRAAEVDVLGKGGRRERMPLPEDVGQAVVDYLRRGRPETSSRSVFVRFVAPRTGLDASGVTAIVHRAGIRAGVAVTGAHQLRHTVAVDLLRAGAPMSEISELLRHRRAATTAIYAKVDSGALAPLARPWPAGA